MLEDHPILWVVGPSRSGTSMTAGLFYKHEVFFGECITANRYNPKGYFEHAWLKQVHKGKAGPVEWPTDFYRRLMNEGLCDCGQPVGVKSGPNYAPRILALPPTVIVACRRPLDQIARSRGRVPWAGGEPEKVARRDYRRIEELRGAHDGPFVDVRTDRLAAGEWEDVLPAFEALGVEFKEHVAREWVDPALWDGGN